MLPFPAAINDVAALPPAWMIRSMAAGMVVGLSLGLTGGGGAIFAVPLLVYWIGVDPAAAVGVSLVTVAITAAIGAVERARRGQVEAVTGTVFAAAGMLTAPLGGWIGARMPPRLLLASFAVVMIVVSLRMWAKANDAAETGSAAVFSAGVGPTCRRDPSGRLTMTPRCFTLLGLVGLFVGVLSGMFGVGGGFLIVPALAAFATMDVPRAVGTSLLAMALVGASAVTFQLATGRTVPLGVTAAFVAGSIPALFAGSAIGRRLSGPALARAFAVAILFVALFVIARSTLFP